MQILRIPDGQQPRAMPHEGGAQFFPGDVVRAEVVGSDREGVVLRLEGGNLCRVTVEDGVTLQKGDRLSLLVQEGDQARTELKVLERDARSMQAQDAPSNAAAREAARAFTDMGLSPGRAWMAAATALVREGYDPQTAAFMIAQFPQNEAARSALGEMLAAGLKNIGQVLQGLAEALPSAMPQDLGTEAGSPQAGANAPMAGKAVPVPLGSLAGMEAGDGVPEAGSGGAEGGPERPGSDGVPPTGVPPGGAGDINPAGAAGPRGMAEASGSMGVPMEAPEASAGAFGNGTEGTAPEASRQVLPGVSVALPPASREMTESLERLLHLQAPRVARELSEAEGMSPTATFLRAAAALSSDAARTAIDGFVAAQPLTDAARAQLAQVLGQAVDAAKGFSPQAEAKGVADSLAQLLARFSAAEAEPEAMAARTRELREALTGLARAASRDPSVPALVAQRATELVEQVRITDQFDRIIYAQIPIQVGEEKAASELYILRRRGRNAAIDPENATFALCLDTRNMGRVESLIRIEGKTVSLHMRMGEARAVQSVKDRSVEIYAALRDAGYHLGDLRCTPLEEAIVPQTAPAELAREFGGMGVEVYL